MKRRVEDTAKQENSVASVYPQHRHSGGSVSPQGSTHQRILTSVTGSGVQTFHENSSGGALKGEGGAGIPSSVQIPVQSFTTAMPGATTPNPSVKTSAGGLQGGAPGTATSHPLHGVGNLQSQAHQQQAMHQAQAHQQVRHKVHSAAVPQSTQGQQQFQRLKVEDALSYLDQVKYKFGNQPQVYNDFLDIMKEFKSQSIDTPGVIARVSNLFKGHPELIVGFNTFLPPGYKIEVQANEQVSVSMPSPTTTTTVVHTPTGTISHHPPLSSTQHSNSSSVPVKSSVPQVQHNNSGSSSHVSSHHSATSHHSYNQPLSTPPSAPTGTSQTNSQSPAHNQLPANAEGLQPTPHSQPVEFNHAINYVNKIKNRFQGQPDKYKRFLEILHTYQKEQRSLKEGLSTPGKHLTEAEVYSQVAKLFENQEDLLQEFGQFLPDATSHQAALGCKGITNDHTPVAKKTSSAKPSYNSSSGSGSGTLNNANKFGQQLKRSPSLSSSTANPPPIKKQKTVSLRDVTLAEAGKYGSLTEYAFFDKVRKALKSQEVYENFLRCLVLYNQEVVSRTELVQLVTPFLGKFPELFRWFKDFIGYNDGTNSQCAMEPISNNITRQDRPTGDLAMEIDYSTCKRLGASYCALPKTYVQPKCTGRTTLCKEVLNDTWVSFPSWSEDSTFVTSRKTQYEEYIYRCEDERFELDVVIETNAATIRVLEGVQKKMSRMSPEDISKFRLDDCLGGSSPTIHQRAIRRIYGDKSQDIIDGLKKNPLIAIPMVLRRLKAKEEEWREAQKGFNKIWREQNEKYYLKSLDHQGINFKQNDIKALRSKSLFNEIETMYDERHEQAEEGTGEILTGPHLIMPYKDKTVLDDAANLLIHHVKRQTGIHKEDKQRIKNLVRQFIPDLFFHPRQELSEDEREDEDDKEEDEIACGANNLCSLDNKSSAGQVKMELNGVNRTLDSMDENESKHNPIQIGDSGKDDEKIPLHALSTHPDEYYTLFMANNNWYLFLRLHQILCERLTKMYEQAVRMAADEARDKKERKESTAVALRLKPKRFSIEALHSLHNLEEKEMLRCHKYAGEIEVEDYYPAFLDMVKNVLDGNIDSNAYEDTLREMFGIHAYMAFTLDKVVTYAVRQLQHLVTDETCQECMELFQREQRRGAAGGPCNTAHQRAGMELVYQRHAEHILADENCFKLYVYKHDCKLTVELLDTEVEEPEPATEVEKWSTYIEKFATNGETLSDELREQLVRKPVFLPRNVRRWRQKASKGKEAKLNKDVKNRHNDKVEIEVDDDEEGREKKEKSSSSDEEKPENEERANTAKQKRINNSTAGNIDVMDATQCRFNLNAYTMVFVVNKESYLYKRQALKRARESHKAVSIKLNSKFRAWHNHWSGDNVTDSQQKSCVDWLMGRGDGVIPNRTRVLTDNDLAKPPYSSYNRYRVERLDES